MKKVMEIIVKAQSVKCPHCDSKQDGWLGDPRGVTTECDDCGKEYSVSQEATLTHE